MGARLPDGVSWIGPCEAVDDDHMHISVFLIETSGRYVVVDTGSIVHTSVIDRGLSDRIDGPVDAIVITHTDLPHIGNLRTLQRRWPEADVITGAGIPEIVGLPDGTKQSIVGEREVIGGRPLEFIDPPLADRSNTTWIYDDGSGVLFTSDGFGYYHRPGQCRATSREITMTADGVYRYHQTALPWLQYAEPGLVTSRIDRLLDRFDPSYLAPSHGVPIAAEDIEAYLRTFETAIGGIVSSHAGST